MDNAKLNVSTSPYLAISINIKLGKRKPPAIFFVASVIKAKVRLFTFYVSQRVSEL